MIRCIEALGYRCLRDIQQPVSNFQILVGPNASGKTTFLDVVRFLSDLVSSGLENAIIRRTNNLQDLFWNRQGDKFELAVEFEIPDEKRRLLPSSGVELCRYEVAIGIDHKTDENVILSERLLLKPLTQIHPVQRDFFPMSVEARSTILSKVPAKGTKTIINKVAGGNDNFYDETGKGWDHAFKLGPRKSALANLPDDETKFPVATWVKSLLSNKIEAISLSSSVMRMSSPPGQPRGFRPDGSNLPWVVEHLRQKNNGAFNEWIAHVRTAQKELKTVETIEQPDNKHRFLQILYGADLKVPAWMASDGTLRLLALTLLAYSDEKEKIYLIEEPENGIHPQAVETVYQSLSSTYDKQVFCASHSPVILSLADPKDLLCFALNDDGAADIVRGDQHPNLKDWKREADLGTLFATGVLG